MLGGRITDGRGATIEGLETFSGVSDGEILIGDGTSGITGAGITTANGQIVDTSTILALEDQTVTDSDVLVPDTSLTLPIFSGIIYSFEAKLAFTTVNTSGVKVAINCSVAPDLIFYTAEFHGVSTPAFLHIARTTTNGDAIGHTATGTACEVHIWGAVLAGAGDGDMTIEFAQNAETGAGESVTRLQWSNFKITRFS